MRAQLVVEKRRMRVPFVDVRLSEGLYEGENGIWRGGAQSRWL